MPRSKITNSEPITVAGADRLAEISVGDLYIVELSLEVSVTPEYPGDPKRQQAVTEAREQALKRVREAMLRARKAN